MSTDVPMGRLSGIKVNQKLLQIQTEAVVHPRRMLVSVVICDGKVIHKYESENDYQLDDPDIQKLIEEQHARVEDSVREKLRKISESRGENPAP